MPASAGFDGGRVGCESGGAGLCPGLIDVLPGEVWRGQAPAAVAGVIDAGWRLARRAELSLAAVRQRVAQGGLGVASRFADGVAAGEKAPVIHPVALGGPGCRAVLGGSIKWAAVGVLARP